LMVPALALRGQVRSYRDRERLSDPSANTNPTSEYGFKRQR
jgi:hypothetical protein